MRASYSWPCPACFWWPPQHFWASECWTTVTSEKCFFHTLKGIFLYFVFWLEAVAPAVSLNASEDSLVLIKVSKETTTRNAPWFEGREDWDKLENVPQDNNALMRFAFLPCCLNEHPFHSLLQSLMRPVNACHALFWVKACGKRWWFLLI